MYKVSHILLGQSLNFSVMGMYTEFLFMVMMKEARTFIPPEGDVNFSRMVWRGRRRRSPGSVSSKPISTYCIGSACGCWTGVAVEGGNGVIVFEAAGVVGAVEVTWVGSCVEVTGVGVAGVAGFAGTVDGVEGRGMRVTGVAIGARWTGGGGIGVKLPEGGGIRVTGVESGRG